MLDYNVQIAEIPCMTTPKSQKWQVIYVLSSIVTTNFMNEIKHNTYYIYIFFKTHCLYYNTIRFVLYDPFFFVPFFWKRMMDKKVQKIEKNKNISIIEGSIHDIGEE